MYSERIWYFVSTRRWFWPDRSARAALFHIVCAQEKNARDTICHLFLLLPWSRIDHAPKASYHFRQMGASTHLVGQTISHYRVIEKLVCMASSNKVPMKVPYYRSNGRNGEIRGLERCNGAAEISARRTDWTADESVPARNPSPHGLISEAEAGSISRRELQKSYRLLRAPSLLPT
jgi:hypothetical protein